MRYGIIGTGWIAGSFIEGARLKCDAEIYAVYSRTAAKGGEFAARNGIECVYTDFDEFLQSDIEAVYVASPNVCHYEQSKRCLEAGKHVICEKPVTVTYEQYSECKAIADSRGLVYLEAIMYMHTPGRDRLREAVASIGRISGAHFDFSQLSSKYPAYLRGENPNIFNPEMATGALMDLGIYCVYPALDLFGDPVKMHSDAVFLESGADSVGTAILNYGDKIVTLTYSKTAQDYKGSQILGDRGTITVESISKLVNGFVIDSEGKKSEILPDIPKAELMGFEAEDFERFIDNIADEKYALCDSMTRRVLKLMERIRECSGIHFGKENQDA